MTVELPLTDLETVLTTTRSVRRRLDVDRPVPWEPVAESLALALQAPTGGNAQDWRFVVIGAPGLRARIGDHYASCFDRFVRAPLEAAGRDAPEVRGRLDPSPAAERMLAGAAHLASIVGRAPWLVLACATRPNPERDPVASGTTSAVYGSVYPAVWSLCLALRARGLGSIITTLHLNDPEPVAELLGLPDDTTQVCLVPIAHTRGLEFRPAPRRPFGEVVFRDRWGEPAPG